MTTPTPTPTHPHTTDNIVPLSHVQTFTGRHINPFDPDPAAIDIEDIAHALSHICRFTGHTRTFYSVAQHSVHVADLVARNGHSLPKPAFMRAVLAALLHDASEAYLTDIPRPLKRHVYARPNLAWAPEFPSNLRHYYVVEADLQLVIYQKFGLTSEDIREHSVAIHDADMTLLATERRDLLTRTSAVWPELERFAPLPDRITPMHSGRAKVDFLRFFEQLQEELRS